MLKSEGGGGKKAVAEALKELLDFLETAVHQILHARAVYPQGGWVGGWHRARGWLAPSRPCNALIDTRGLIPPCPRSPPLTHTPKPSSTAGGSTGCPCSCRGTRTSTSTSGGCVSEMTEWRESCTRALSSLRGGG